MNCINLQKRFGRRYRVAYEESYYAEFGSRITREVPELMILLCRYGHIYPAGGTMLAASVDGHPNVAGRLRRLKCCRPHQDGDFGELTVLFDVADFAEIAKIMRPRRRRQISEAERSRLRNIGFTKHDESRVDVQQTARGGVSDARGDSEPVRQQLALFDGCTGR